MHRRMQIAIQLKDVQFFVVLELVRPILGNFDDCPKDLRGPVADRQLQVIDHCLLASSPKRLGSGPGCAVNSANACHGSSSAGTTIIQQMKAHVYVTLKTSVLDPQGQTFSNSF